MNLALGLPKPSTFTIIQLKKIEELNKWKFKEEENELLQASIKEKKKKRFLIKMGNWEMGKYFPGLYGISGAVYMGSNYRELHFP